MLGGIALRDGDDDYVSWAGHVGYGIRPSARRRGLGGWALGRVLDEARGTGMDRVLAVCAVDNAASVKTIERCGGAFEGISDSGTALCGVTGSSSSGSFHPFMINFCVWAVQGGCRVVCGVLPILRAGDG